MSAVNYEPTMPRRRLNLLRELSNLPPHACRFNVNLRIAEHLCRDGLAECVGELGNRGFAYVATNKGRIVALLAVAA